MAGLTTYGAEDLLCVGRDPELWFSSNPEEIRLAKGYCALCPARDACLRTALREEARLNISETKEVCGIRGGTTPAERLPIVLSMQYMRRYGSSLREES